MTTYLNQILYNNKKFDSFNTIELLKPYMYVKIDNTIYEPLIIQPPIINTQPSIIQPSIIQPPVINTQPYNQPRKNNNIIHPKCTDTLFWCLYIAKYGYGDYLNIGQKYKNKEIEIKQQLIEIIKNTPVKLKSGPRKITNVAVQEIMAELMIDSKTTMKTFYAMCLLNQLNMYIVDTASKTYLQFATIDQSDQSDQSIHYIIYRSVSGFFSIDIEEKTTEQLTEITTYMVELEHGDRPIKSISSYKVIDLETMAQKLDISIDSQKIKKQELYDKILVKCQWNK